LPWYAIAVVLVAPPAVSLGGNALGRHTVSVELWVEKGEFDSVDEAARGAAAAAPFLGGSRGCGVLPVFLTAEMTL